MQSLARTGRKTSMVCRGHIKVKQRQVQSGSKRNCRASAAAKRITDAERKAIDKLNVASKGTTLPQTVHNELIRDPRFILVGRGIYALKEWGYLPGQVRDIIVNILKENKKPLSKDEIVKKVLSQRLVKENTILLNLQNKDYFSKNSQGKYILKA